MYDDYDGVMARYYDAAYAALPSLGPDLDFYRAIAAEAGGPILELGCGTGRVLSAIAADAHSCTGLDASPAMLQHARARCGPATLVVGDMRDFDLAPQRFALIYSAFRAFQHLVEVEDQLRCLGRVRAHLAPGGTFAFDVFNPRLARMAEDTEPENEDLRFTQDGEAVVRYASVVRDRARQTMRVTFRYERHRDDRVVGNDSAAFDMRWFFRFELLHLMARAGFGDVTIHGDFDRSSVGPASPSLIVVARERSGESRSARQRRRALPLRR